MTTYLKTNVSAVNTVKWKNSNEFIEAANDKQNFLANQATSTAWPVDVIYMEISDVIAVACSNFSLNFYDGRTMSLTGRFRQLSGSPTKLCYKFLKEQKQELLAVGDCNGKIVIFKLQENSWVFPDNSHYKNHLDTPTGVILKAEKSLHSDAITCMTHNKAVKCIITSSMDGTITLFDHEKLELKCYYKQHRKAVFCLEQLNNDRLMLSGGLGFSIHCWNPFTATLSNVNLYTSFLFRNTNQNS